MRTNVSVPNTTMYSSSRSCGVCGSLPLGAYHRGDMDPCWPIGADSRPGVRGAAVFLAAFHHDPALLDPVRDQVARMREAVAADGLPSGHGMAIMVAGDGLFMARIFGLYTLESDERLTVHAALSTLLEPRS